MSERENGVCLLLVFEFSAIGFSRSWGKAEEQSEQSDNQGFPLASPVRDTSRVRAAPPPNN